MLRARAQGKGLADDDPREGAPGHGEGGDEHAGCDDHDDARAGVLGWGAGGAHGGEDEQPGGLPEGAGDHGGAPADALDDVEAGEGHGNVDGAEDELDHDRVVDSCGFEDGGAVLGGER